MTKPEPCADCNLQTTAMHLNSPYGYSSEDPDDFKSVKAPWALLNLSLTLSVQRLRDASLAHQLLAYNFVATVDNPSSSPPCCANDGLDHVFHSTLTPTFDTHDRLVHAGRDGYPRHTE